MFPIKLLNFAQIKFYFLESPPVHFALIIQKMSLPEKPTFSYFIKTDNREKIWDVSGKCGEIWAQPSSPAHMVEIRSKGPRRSDGGTRVRLLLSPNTDKIRESLSDNISPTGNQAGFPPLEELKDTNTNTKTIYPVYFKV